MVAPRHFREELIGTVDDFETDMRVQIYQAMRIGISLVVGVYRFCVSVREIILEAMFKASTGPFNQVFY